MDPLFPTLLPCSPQPGDGSGSWRAHSHLLLLLLILVKDKQTQAAVAARSWLKASVLSCKCVLFDLQKQRRGTQPAP